MAIQYIKEQPGIGGLLGAGIGQGVSEGIQSMLQERLNMLKQQQQSQKGRQFFQPILGNQVAPEMINALANADPRDWPKLLTALSGGQGFNIGQPADQLGTQPAEAAQMGAQPPSEFRIGVDPQERRFQQQYAQTERKELRKDYKDYVDKLEKNGLPAKKLWESANEVLDILKRGQAITGLKGKLTPQFLQTSDGQRLTTLLNEIVLAKDSALPGRNTAKRLKLLEESKAAIWQQPQVIADIMQSILDDDDIIRPFSRWQAFKELEDDFDEQIPSDYKKMIAKKAKGLKKSYEQLDELPDAAQFPGKVITDTQTGEKFKSMNGKWVPLDEKGL